MTTKGDGLGDRNQVQKMAERHMEWMRDRVRKMLGLRILDKHMRAIDLDALNEYYGFHGGPCPATSSSATPTLPPTT